MLELIFKKLWIKKGIYDSWKRIASAYALSLIIAFLEFPTAFSMIAQHFY